MLRQFLLVSVVILLIFPGTSLASDERFITIIDNNECIIAIDTQSIHYRYSPNNSVKYIDVCTIVKYTPLGVLHMLQQRIEHGLPSKGYEYLAYSVYRYIMSYGKVKIIETCDIDIDKKAINQISAEDTEWNPIGTNEIVDLVYNEVIKYLNQQKMEDQKSLIPNNRPL